MKKKVKDSKKVYTEAEKEEETSKKEVKKPRLNSVKVTNFICAIIIVIMVAILAVIIYFFVRAIQNRQQVSEQSLYPQNQLVTEINTFESDDQLIQLD